MSLKRASALELLDELAQCEQSWKRVAGELCDALWDPSASIAAGAVESLRDCWQTLERRRAADASRVPSLPLDCWQLIAELALRRRPLCRWASQRTPGEPPRCVVPPAHSWLPRSENELLELTDELHRLRRLSSGIRARIDAVVVRTVVLPVVRWDDWNGRYGRAAVAAAERFASARELVIPSGHRDHIVDNATLRVAVHMVEAAWQRAPPRAAVPVVRCDTTMRYSDAYSLPVANAITIGNGLKQCLPISPPCSYWRPDLTRSEPTAVNVPFYGAIRSFRCVDAERHYVFNARLDALADAAMRTPGFACETLWVAPPQPRSAHIVADWVTSQPGDVASLRRLYVFVGTTIIDDALTMSDYPRLEDALLAYRWRTDPGACAVRSLCAQAPSLTEVHLIASRLPPTIAVDLALWRVEVQGRFEIYVHVDIGSFDLLLTNNERPDASLANAFCEQGIGHLLTFDAAGMIATAFLRGVL